MSENHPILIVAVIANNRAELIQILQQGGAIVVDMRKPSGQFIKGLPRPYVDVMMPCGERVLYYCDELPEKDVPCACGDKTHWFLRYRIDPNPFELPPLVIKPETNPPFTAS